MKCPFCGGGDTQVTDTRLNEEGDIVRRRRRCVACGKRYTTYERAELRMPQVVKKDGSRVDFDRAKLEASMQLALRKRPVPAQDVEAAVQRIEEEILAMAVREVSSERVGEMVMRELKALDKIAYIRFASVYRAFEDLDDFSEALREVRQTRAGPRKPPAPDGDV